MFATHSLVLLLAVISVVHSDEAMEGLHISFLGYDLEKRKPLHQYPIIRNAVTNDLEFENVVISISPEELSTPFGSEIVNVSWSFSESKDATDSDWIGLCTVC